MTTGAVPSAAPLVAIVGPTAAGKSDLGLRVAREWRGEIVCCDSLHVYRHLDIGSAKPSLAERAQVTHHLVDVVDPDQDFSAAEYARLARLAVRDIAARGSLPVVVGGTGLYLKALLQGLFSGPGRDAALRARLEAIAGRRGDAGLHRLLARVDPEAAGRIAPRDRVRVVRALEVFLAGGRTITERQREAPDVLAGFAPLVVGLRPDRAWLRQAVERRTEAMIEAGLLDEVSTLLGRGYAADLRPLQSIGYRQAVAVLEGRAPRDGLGAQIVTATMRYAKRQLTWFRHQADVSWFESPEAAHRFIQETLATGPAPRIP